MKKYTVILLLLIFSQSFAQITYHRIYGTPSTDNANMLKSTTDGGYIIIGESQIGSSPYDIYVVKCNSWGTLQWARRIGGTLWETVRGIVQSSDGGYALGGSTNSFGAGSDDLLIVKLDGGGLPLWSKTIGGTGIDISSSILQSSDKGYILSGRTYSFPADSAQILFVKLDSTGALQWSKTMGGTGKEMVYDCIKTTDGGYAFTGYTSSFGAGSYDILFVKLDSAFNIQWSKTAGSMKEEAGFSIIQTSDGGYAIAGYTYNSVTGFEDMYIIKFDISGMQQWNKIIDQAIYDEAYSIIQNADGSYIVGGYSEYEPYYGHLVKLNSSGAIQWSKNILNDINSIVLSADGGFAIGGTLYDYAAWNSNFGLVKFDSSWNTCGNIINYASTAGTLNTTVTSQNFTFTSRTLTLNTPSLGTSTGGTQTNICSPAGIKTINLETPKEFSLSQNYPNPFNPVTKIKFDIPQGVILSGAKNLVSLKVYDILGKEIQTLVNEQLQPGSYEVTFDGSNLSSGIYYYILFAGDFIDTKKMVLIK